jgi:3-phosphoshikimate 1-carboxyvinyltransferase
MSPGAFEGSTGSMGSKGSAPSSSLVELPDPYVMRPFGGPINARVRPPGSKSFTNRALCVAALATGTSLLRGVLFSDDTEAMLGCLDALGIATVVDRDACTVLVTGCGGVPNVDGVSLFVRQSGTTARFVVPFAALGHGTVIIDGHEQMRARPNGDLVDGLRQLGVHLESVAEPSGVPGGLPIRMHANGVVGGAITVAGNVSSQYLSGLLLSAPCFASGLDVTVVGELVSQPYVDMTIATMRAYGATVETFGYERFVVSPGGYSSCTYDIEPDASAASYFFGAAAICGGRITVEGLGSSAVQGDIEFAAILGRMGATIEQTETETTVIVDQQLHGIDVDMADCSDTAQTLAAVAVYAKGPTSIRGIGFIRFKEIDRVSAVVTELQRCGIAAQHDSDGFTVVPPVPFTLETCVIVTSNDHRMAMSFSLLGLGAPGIAIADPGCVRKTFPNYFAVLESLRPIVGEVAGVGAGAGAVDVGVGVGAGISSENGNL